MQVQTIPGTNLGYMLVPETALTPETVALNQPFITPADVARTAAVNAGWTPLPQDAYATNADGEPVWVEFYYRKDQG